MNLSGKDRQKIFWNAIARGGGIDKIDLASELAKSVAMLNGFQAQDAMNEVQMQGVPPMNPPQGTGGTISSQPPQSTPEAQSGLGGSNLP